MNRLRLLAAAPEWCYRPWVVYEAKATQTLSAICQKRLALGEVNYALFYSVRTAEIFERLVKEGALAACCETLTAVGLSEAIGQAPCGLPFRQVWCAPEPTEDLFSVYFRWGHSMSEQQGQQEAQTSNVVEDVPAGEKANACCASSFTKNTGLRIALYALVVLAVAAASYYAAMRLPLAVPTDPSSALSACGWMKLKGAPSTLRTAWPR